MENEKLKIEVRGSSRGLLFSAVFFNFPFPISNLRQP